MDGDHAATQGNGLVVRDAACSAFDGTAGEITKQLVIRVGEIEHALAVRGGPGSQFGDQRFVFGIRLGGCAVGFRALFGGGGNLVTTAGCVVKGFPEEATGFDEEMAAS